MRTMKRNISLHRFFTVICVLFTFGIGQMWAETVLFYKNGANLNEEGGVFAYFYSSSYWDNDKGAGSNGIASSCNTMAKLGYDGSKDIFVYQISGNYSYVAVMQDSKVQDNFWETCGCAATYDACDGLYSISNPMMISTTSNPFTKNSGKTTYYHFSWGVPTVWLKHANWDGSNWGWKQMTYDNDGSFHLDANYTNGNGCNYGCQSGNENDYISNPTKTPNSTWNHLARFKMTFSGSSINLAVTELFKVEFDLQGHGSAVADQYVLYNNTVAEPDEPAQTGYTFGGWFTNEACTSGYTFSAAVTSDINTLYAKWTAKEYTLTFNKNGEAWSDEAATTTKTRKIKFDKAYSEDYSSQGDIPSMATKNGYYFRGWYTESSGGIKIINADGSWVQSISNYTDGSGHWIHDGGQTLYAQFGTPNINNISFSSSNVLPLDSVTVTPIFSQAPEGTHTICYKLTTGTGTVLEVQPTFVQKDGYSVKFESPATPGQYSVEVRLFAGSGHSCADESTGLVYSYTSHATKFTVETSNAVTVLYKCGEVELRPSSITQATSSQTAATVTAPTIEGFTFTGWTLGANVSLASGTVADNPIHIYASSASTLTANYSQGPLFFKNTLNWDKVYIYFYNSTSYWTTSSGNSEGTGSATDNQNFISGPHEMTLLAGTDDVYYYDGNIPGSMRAVAFTKESMTNYNFFAGPTANTDPCHVVYVNAFDANKPMVVPVGNGALWNQNYAKYYSHDVAPLLQDWGYTLRSDVDSWDATSHRLTSAKLGELSFSTTLYLDQANHEYQWKIYKGDTGYGIETKTILTPSNVTSPYLENHNEMGYNVYLQSNNPGEYTFTLNYGLATSTEVYTGAATSSGLVQHMTITVTYPVGVGDFRLVYTGGEHPHPGDAIKKRANGVDIVNMFVATGQSEALKLQPCTEVNASSVTWKSLNSCSAPTYKDVDFDAILSKGGSGVYNFTFEQNENGENPTITKIEKYTGRFYVRTDCVNSDKWNYKASKDAHAMTYSEYSMSSALPSAKQFSHYYVKDLHGSAGSPINIKFTVATDFSQAITDTIVNGLSDDTDPYYDAYGNVSLNRIANVRFTYNQATNKIWRAYTLGPSDREYMVLRTDNSHVFKASSGGSAVDTLRFVDMGNWVYQVDAYATKGAYVKLTARMFNSASTSITQYLKGNDTDGYNSETAVLLFDGSSTSREHMRITYDFKTDRMMTSWIPSNTISGDININADIVLIRTHQSAGQSITFSNGATLSGVNTVYGVMEFQKDYLNDVSRSRYSRNIYWISFPFDVQLSDVFGFGTYGQHWIIEYYDGQERAQKGYWSDSPSFWKFVTPEMRNTYTMEANKGYVLALDLDELGTSASVWDHDVNTIYLYFPSRGTIGDITKVDSKTVPMNQEGYVCTIDKTGNDGADINLNRKIADSYWHIIGAPSYANAEHASGTTMPSTSITNDLLYVYEWNPTTNQYSVHSTSSMTFDAMRAYMVQYNGTSITWSSVSAHPSSIVARHSSIANLHSVEFNINLKKENESLDHTYIHLTDEENITEGFEFGKDLCKEFNANKANIYTIISNYIPAAGNTLPLNTSQATQVAVGVQIAEDGNYTFAIPDGTNGIGVTLIDNETGTRTNLSAIDYNVNLSAGTYDNRFTLEISAVDQTPTNIEESTSEEAKTAGARKLLIDGVLYIVRDGNIYDARGVRIE